MSGLQRVGLHARPSFPILDGNLDHRLAGNAEIDRETARLIREYVKAVLKVKPCHHELRTGSQFVSGDRLRYEFTEIDEVKGFLKQKFLGIR